MKTESALLGLIAKIKTLSSEDQIHDYGQLIQNMNEINSLCTEVVGDESDEDELEEIDFSNFEPDPKFSITDNLSDFCKENVRDIFDFDEWDEVDSKEKLFKYNDVIYKVEIRENGCCEATHEHRIMYWNADVTVYNN